MNLQNKIIQQAEDYYKNHSKILLQDLRALKDQSEDEIIKQLVEKAYHDGQ
jgi:hypothetical protein